MGMSIEITANNAGGRTWSNATRPLRSGHFIYMNERRSYKRDEVRGEGSWVDAGAEGRKKDRRVKIESESSPRI